MEILLYNACGNNGVQRGNRKSGIMENPERKKDSALKRFFQEKEIRNLFKLGVWGLYVFSNVRGTKRYIKKRMRKPKFASSTKIQCFVLV